MKKKCRKKSPMTLHLWLYFAIFAIVIMIALWLLQVVFLNTFYEDMKRDEVEKIGDRIVELYNSDDGEFESYWQENSFRGGVFAHILTEDGSFVMSPEFMEEFKIRQDAPPPRARRGENFRRDENFSPETWKTFVERVSNSDGGRISYVINDRSNARTVVYGALLKSEDGEKRYLYISSILYPIDTTRKVLQKQLVIVSILSLLLSFTLAYFIAKRFSRPITKASKTAQELADGNYDVSFEGGSYLEMSNLANVLNNAARQLGKTDELRRDLMANVSHDLKTPLTIIKSYAEMIRDISGDDREKRNEHTKVIIDESNRLSLLVNDILSLSKLQAGIGKLEKKEFSLSDAVNSVIERFSNFSLEKDYKIIARVEDSVFVFADEGQILQVIYNLIGNGVNYTKDGGRVWIRLENKGEKIRFEVRDEGDGIDPGELPFVWDRYYRSGTSHKRGVTGTGIGLSIVKQIISAHNGAYGAESVPGEGSVFWFELESGK